MTEPVKGKVTDWLDGDALEPVWPKEPRPTTHLCEGCGKERPDELFEAVDAFAAGRYIPLVRCDECRGKPDQLRAGYQADRAWHDARYPIEHGPTCNVNPTYSTDPKTWSRGCDCGATARAAAKRPPS